MKRLPIVILYVLLSAGFINAQDPTRFREEVQKIQERNRSYNPNNVILFTGSSSIRLWKDLQERFPDKNIVNTGFGGSQMSDLIYYSNELIVQYRPKQIFIYEGDNDLAGNKSPEQVLKDTKKLLRVMEKKLPNVPIVFISPKPSIKRWHLRDVYREYISLLNNYLKKYDLYSLIDVWPVMLDSNQQLLPGIFKSDNLHLNQQGYDIWENKIGPYLLSQ